MDGGIAHNPTFADMLADDGSGRTSLIKRGCAMGGRKTGAFGLRLGAGHMLAAMFVAANLVSTPAAAQGNCPPGQVFVPIETNAWDWEG
jgi:hypothetical protein